MFVSFVFVSNGGVSEKHSAELKTRNEEDNPFDCELHWKVSVFTKVVGERVNANLP